MGQPAPKVLGHRPKAVKKTADVKPGGSSQAPRNLKLKKGDILFKEGENSRAMYLIKSGVIRIFKKKGESSIEIGTIHSGQILGELAFLDGQPRSASGEALTNCELVEISSSTFTLTLGKMPDWLKLLLKTIVGRLRSASTRIKQLETAGTAVDYKADGHRSTAYAYLTIHDAMKIASAVLLCAARNGKPTEKGIEFPHMTLQRYSNQIMGIPMAKVMTFVDDVLIKGGLVEKVNLSDTSDLIVNDINLLEKFISWTNERNLMEPTKRKDLSNKTFFVMSLIAKYLPEYEINETTGEAKVNIGDIRASESQAMGKDAFRLEEVEELEKTGHCGSLDVKSQEEAYVRVNVKHFTTEYRLFHLTKAIDAVNEDKRKKTGR